MEWEIHFKKSYAKNRKNIAGRLPENSRNRFVDRQSKKNSKKKADQKKLSFD